MKQNPSTSEPLVLLGIDPGLANCGWGVVEKLGCQYSPIAYGCIHTRSSDEITVRLEAIFDEILAVIMRFKPTAVGIESIYFGANSKSAFATGQARGAALVACAKGGLELGEYTPMQIKQSVVGTGTADKDQVMFMVRAILNLDHDPRPDHCSDALAAAICHGNLRNVRRLEKELVSDPSQDMEGRSR